MLFPSYALDTNEAAMPPTDFMLKMRKYIMFIGLIQLCCVLARLSVGDVMGAICMSIVVSMVYMITWGQPPLHIRWVFMWSFFCFINAGFDFAIAAVRTVHVYEHYDRPGSSDDIKSRVPMWQICVVLISGWLGAFSEIAGALVGYKIFQDFQEQEISQYDSYGAGFGFPQAGMLLGSGYHGSHGHGVGGGHGTENYGAAGGGPGSGENGGANSNTSINGGSGPQFSSHVGHINDSVDPFNGARNSSNGSGTPAVQPFQGKAHKLDN